MAVPISRVLAGSPAERCGVRAGETLLAVDDKPINDVLDYGFYTTAARLRLTLRGADGAERAVSVVKEEYQELGLESASFLMDRQHSCSNKCIFCFIDQLPPGLRESLYFKDDDERLSFLFGNYITLTNLGDHEIDRIIEMHVSPINISVHTTDPALRCKMMGNRFAGDKLRYLQKIADAGIEINCQIVLCRGVNDGAQLEKTLGDLTALHPAVRSIACVPVGVTAYRDGLAAVETFDEQSGAAVLDVIERCAAQCREQFGENLVHAADEFYLMAGRPIPPLARYDDLLQIENGVGMLAVLEDEFSAALEEEPGDGAPREAFIVTGTLAAQPLEAIIAGTRDKFPGLKCDILPIRNEFFGGNVSVSGLVTATDIQKQLAGRKIRAERILMPANMLRREGDMFLDSVTLEELEAALGKPLRVVEDGADLVAALLGR